MTASRAGGRTPAQLFCMVVGIVLVLAGVLGFFANSSFAVGDSLDRDALLGLDVNGIHNIVHLASGALLLAVAGTRAGAKAGATAFGAVYALVTVIGFIQGDNILSLLPINTADNILHLALAALGLAVGLTSPGREAGAGAGRPATA